MESQWKSVEATTKTFGHWLFFGEVTLQPWVMFLLFIFAIWLALARASE